MTYAACLVALAHPTRRAVLERLLKRPHTVSELVGVTKVSQPGLSQHLRVLRQARLVVSRPQGTRRYYQASPEGLGALRQYVESMWDDVLRAFATSDSRRTRKGMRKPTPA